MISVLTGLAGLFITHFFELSDQWSYTQRNQSGILQKPEVKSSKRLSENRLATPPKISFKSWKQREILRGIHPLLLQFLWCCEIFYTKHKQIVSRLSRNGVVYHNFYFLNWSHTHLMIRRWGVAQMRIILRSPDSRLSHNPFIAICSQNSQGRNSKHCEKQILRDILSSFCITHP